MSNITFKFNARDRKRFQAVVKKKPDQFFDMVRDLWAETDSGTVGNIIKDQLSGRKGNFGLFRRSGNAARALNVKVRRLKNDVVSTLFLLNRGGVKKYLPIHDKSWKGSRVIKAKNKPYLVFKMETSARIFSKSGKKLKKAVAGFTWIRTKQVTIPERTDILGFYLNEGGIRRRRDVKKALRLVFNG